MSVSATAQHSPMRIRDDSADFEHSRDVMERLWSTAKVSVRQDRTFRSHIDTIVMPLVSFGANATVEGLAIRNLILPESWLLTIPLEGRSMHVIDGQTHLASGSNAVLHPVDRPLEMRTVSNVTSLQVNIDSKAVESAVGLYRGEHLARFEMPVVDIDMASELARKAKSLSDHCLRSLGDPSRVAASSPLSLRILERRWIQVIAEWLCGSDSNLERPYDLGLIYVTRAEEYIRANLDQPLSLAELAEHCGVSGRALLLGFRKFRGTSPIHFWRNLRFEAAHRELSSAEVYMGVTEIALRWGFSHLGRFSTDYRKLFLETPSETRKRAVSNGIDRVPPEFV
jgi:AraC-like DNA-binding protein